MNHVGGRHGQEDLRDVQDYIDIVFAQSTDEDFWLNYVKKRYAFGKLLNQQQYNLYILSSVRRRS